MERPSWEKQLDGMTRAEAAEEGRTQVTSEEGRGRVGVETTGCHKANINSTCYSEIHLVGQQLLARQKASFSFMIKIITMGS